MPPTPNIIIFGETGAGKSSLINMLANSHHATVSSAPTGCTFHSQRYELYNPRNNQKYNIYDTAGFDEGEGGTVPKSQAIAQVYQLLNSLGDGVNLLVFCMRAPRIRDSAHKNWKMFREVFCQSQVPIVLVVTGLELEDNRNDWWTRNAGAFWGYGMYPAGVACVTATQGKLKNGNWSLAEEYAECRNSVWDVIGCHALGWPWKMQRVEWFKTIVHTWVESRTCRSSITHRREEVVLGPGIRALMNKCGMSEYEARELVRQIGG